METRCTELNSGGTKVTDGGKAPTWPNDLPDVMLKSEKNPSETSSVLDVKNSADTSPSESSNPTDEETTGSDSPPPPYEGDGSSSGDEASQEVEEEEEEEEGGSGKDKDHHCHLSNSKKRCLDMIEVGCGPHGARMECKNDHGCGCHGVVSNPSQQGFIDAEENQRNLKNSEKSHHSNNHHHNHNETQHRGGAAEFTSISITLNDDPIDVKEEEAAGHDGKESEAEKGGVVGGGVDANAEELHSLLNHLNKGEGDVVLENGYLQTRHTNSGHNSMSSSMLSFGLDFNRHGDDDTIYDDDGLEDPDQGVPIDRGWAWMVCLGSFIMLMIYVGHNNVLAVLLLDIVSEMDVSIGTYNIMLSINGIAYCITTQIAANVLAPRVSVRVQMTVAAVVNVAATLMMVILPNFPVFFTMNVIKFCAHGFALIPSLTLVGYYFSRRRGLATSMALMGMSFGGIVIAPMTRFLKDEFGFRGCMLLLAGYEMHTIMASLVSRPLSRYRRKNKNAAKTTNPDNEKETATVYSHSSHPIPGDDVITLHKYGPSPYGSRKLPRSRMDITEISVSEITIDECQELRRAHPEPHQVSLLRQTLRHGLGSGRSLDYLKSRSQHSSVRQLGDYEDRSSISTGGRLRSVSMRQEDLHRSRRSLRDCIETRSVMAASVFGSSSVGLNILPATQMALESSDPDVIRRRTVGQTVCVCVKSLVEISLFTKPLCLMAMTMYSLTYAGYLTLTYLPAYATRIGITQTQSALLLTVSGLLDVGARIFFSFLADLQWVRPHIIIGITATVIGLITQFIPLFQTFKLLIFFAVMHGIFNSVGPSLYSVFIVDILGIEYLAKMLAVGSMATSILVAAQYAFLGAVIEATHSFNPVFYYAGTSYLVAALLVFLEPILRRLHEAQARKLEEKEAAARRDEEE